MTAVPDRLVAALADRYAIERELGAGGMATVYLAQDLKHDRKVAVKVLRPELAAVLGAERFVQEIKTTAALQHPHILPLFDSGTAGQQDGGTAFLYYVMPYIEGETLRDKLTRETQLSIDEAVKITSEVADALDYAHRHGVIHRDIKPENILLHDGRPMVADFGIALAVSAAAGGRMTETGMSLGTPHYMSPEQATADKDITARSDVYSLASMLYEMLTGEPPHTGASAQAIIMKIIAETAKPVTELRRSVPPNVAAAVGRALEKLPADRFDSAKAFAEALRNPAFRTAAMVTGVTAPAGARVLGRSLSWRAIAGVLAVACVGLAVAWIRAAGRTEPAAPVVRAETTLLTPTDSGVFVVGLDIAPDGSAIVFAARTPGDTTFRLYLRRLDDRAARVIPGTDGGWFPAFSPDGQSIAFVSRPSEIRVTPLEGVTIQAVASGSQVYGLRWGTDGYLYYDQDGGAGLTRVPARGGTPQAFLGSGDPENPDPLPDGRHVLYTECCSDTASVRIVDVETGETRSLDVRAYQARYLDTGHLLLWNTTGLRAVAFDARRLALRGEPFTVLDSVSANGQVRDLAVARNGTAAYVVWPGRSADRAVGLVDLAGRVERLPMPTGNYQALRFSPDGRLLASGRYRMDADTLTVYDLLLGSTTTLNAHGTTGDMVWTPDGAHVVVAGTSRADSQAAVIAFPAAGSGAPDTLTIVRSPAESPVYLRPQAFDPAGRRLLLTRYANGNSDLVVANRDSQRTMTGYLTANWREFDGSISPDGRWVVYTSNEEQSATARSRVYVRSFPQPGERFTVSDSAGESPRWAPDGRTIYYWRGETLAAVSVQTAPTFRVTGRRDLFTLPDARTWAYDVNPNGRGFAVPVPTTTVAKDAAAGPRLVLVANWLEEFRRKAEGH